MQHATFFHSTSSLPQISPCSLGSRWVHGLWAKKSEGVELIVRAITFQDFQSVSLRGPDTPSH